MRDKHPEYVYSGCGASTHLFVNTISREIHLARAGWRLPEPLNPLSLRDFPLSGGYGLRYASAGGSTAAIFKENLADVPPRRLMPPSLMWIHSTNNIADVDFSNAKPLNPSRFQQQAGPCQAF